jgi:hypothetical protein
MQRFDRGGWPAMIMLELNGQLAAAGLDVRAAGRPTLVQSGVDTDDLSDWPLRRVGAGPFGEPNAVATRPRTLTCRIPCGPVRVNRACFSTNAKASFAAA